jgi:hypothetical protein
VIIYGIQRYGIVGLIIGLWVMLGYLRLSWTCQTAIVFSW